MKNSPATNWILLFFTAMIWGSSYILMKKGGQVFTPDHVAAFRLFMAFVALSPFLYKGIKTIPKARWPYIGLAGLVGSLIPATCFAVATQQEDSLLSGILNSLTPLFTLVFGVLFFGVRSKWQMFAGVAVGLMGAAFLVIMKDGSFRFNWYMLLPILATMCYGMSTNIIKTYLDGLKPQHFTALQFTFVGVPCFIYLLSTDFFTPWFASDNSAVLEAAGYIAILGAVNTAFALFIFNHVIQRTTALFASMVTYLIPISAIFWGVFDGEQVGIIHFVGLGLILAGIYITNRRKSRVVA